MERLIPNVRYPIWNDYVATRPIVLVQHSVDYFKISGIVIRLHAVGNLNILFQQNIGQIDGGQFYAVEQ